jgi:endonuclease/exonuclease/phosphatase family metal-dependent hydrolase
MADERTLTALSWNLHKGRSAAGRPAWEKMLSWAKEQPADAFFLQEAQARQAPLGGWRLMQEPHEMQKPGFWARNGEGDGEAEIWRCQASSLAQARNLNMALGTNVFRSRTRHGNALLSHLELGDAQQWDISAHRFERRGLLAARARWGGAEPWLLCSHLALTRGARVRQMEWIAQWIENRSDGAPLILAGDFNDFRDDAPPIFKSVGLLEVAEALGGKKRRTFPAFAPAFALDRMFVRGFEPVEWVEPGPEAAWLSDHLPYIAKLRLPESEAPRGAQGPWSEQNGAKRSA